MAVFAVYAGWRLRNEAPDEVVETSASALPIDDPEACVWRDESDPTVVRFSFDVRAGDFESAMEQTRRCLAPLSDLGLPGDLVRIEAMNETHHSTWTPDA